MISDIASPSSRFKLKQVQRFNGHVFRDSTLKKTDQNDQATGPKIRPLSHHVGADRLQHLHLVALFAERRAIIGIWWSQCHAVLSAFGRALFDQDPRSHGLGRGRGSGVVQ